MFVWQLHARILMSPGQWDCQLCICSLLTSVMVSFDGQSCWRMYLNVNGLCVRHGLQEHEMLTFLCHCRVSVVLNMPQIRSKWAVCRPAFKVDPLASVSLVVFRSSLQEVYWNNTGLQLVCHNIAPTVIWAVLCAQAPCTAGQCRMKAFLSLLQDWTWTLE